MKVHRHHDRQRLPAIVPGPSPKRAASSASKHIFTRPYRPQTNGKAERFIQTALREWAYARAYDTSDQRAKKPAELASPTTIGIARHGSPQKPKPPISRLDLPEEEPLEIPQLAKRNPPLLPPRIQKWWVTASPNPPYGSGT